MRDALSVVRSAVVALWDNAFLVIFCSLAWLFLALLIVPGPPATVALFAISAGIVGQERLLGFSDYLRAVWRYFGVGWRWAAINIPVLLIVAVDIRAVPRMVSPEAAVTIQLALYLALAVWIVINWFALAFLFQQEKPAVVQALRNGGVLLLQHPWFSLALVVMTTVLLALSLVMVIVNMLFGPMLAALIGTQAVADRLIVYHAARRMGE
ncbi:MAG: hypothetical protein R2844_22075 [Caldilineales bacterium]